MQQNALKCDANSVATRILTRENGGGGWAEMWEWCEIGGGGSRRAKIEWYDIWTAPMRKTFTLQIIPKVFILGCI